MKKNEGSIRAEVLETLLQLIPIGKVTTYKSLAKLLNTHPRVIGRLLAENEKLIVVPCHRVVKSNGDVGGYKLGKDFKEKLLKMEGVRIKNGKVHRDDIIDLFLELIHSEDQQ